MHREQTQIAAFVRASDSADDALNTEVLPTSCTQPVQLRRDLHSDTSPTKHSRLTPDSRSTI